MIDFCRFGSDLPGSPSETGNTINYVALLLYKEEMCTTLRESPYFPPVLP